MQAKYELQSIIFGINPLKFGGQVSLVTTGPIVVGLLVLIVELVVVEGTVVVEIVVVVVVVD